MIKITLMNNAENRNKIAILWALIDHRPFAKYRIGTYTTTFEITKKEYTTYKDLINLYCKD